MLIELVFASLASVQAVQTIEAKYSGDLHTEATSIDHEKFDRNFQIRVNYSLKDKVQGEANVSEVQSCDRDDGGQIVECAQYCITKLKMELGQAKVTIVDKDLSRQSNSSNPVVGEIVVYDLKGNRPNCTIADLEGKSIWSKEVAATLEESNGNNVHVTIDPYDASTQLKDHVLQSKVRGLGNNQYELVTPPQLANSTRAWWTYNQTRIWATSGDIRLQAR